jgi:hypothetical protein
MGSGNLSDFEATLSQTGILVPKVDFLDVPGNVDFVVKVLDEAGGLVCMMLEGDEVFHSVHERLLIKTVIVLNLLPLLLDPDLLVCILVVFNGAHRLDLIEDDGVASVSRYSSLATCVWLEDGRRCQASCLPANLQIGCFFCDLPIPIIYSRLRACLRANEGGLLDIELGSLLGI